MSFNNDYFDLNKSLFYKGIAILFIVFHNYLHWQNNFNIENENLFNKDNVHVFINTFYPIQWENTFTSFFSFLGHFGVQIFIFISAYGLAISASKNKVSYFAYLKNRLKKIYFLLFFAIFICLCIYPKMLLSPITFIWKILLLTTTVSSFSNEYLYNMFSGPYWYFALTIQLYIIFPFIFNFFNKLSKKTTLYFLLNIYILIYFLYFATLNSNFTVFGNIIGHLPEVWLGLYLAKFNTNISRSYIIIPSIFIFCFSQIFEYLFPLSFLSALIILIASFNIVYIKSTTLIKKNLIFIGQISMILFIVNGPFRSFPLFKIQEQAIRGERVFLFFILLVILSIFTHKIYNFLCVKFKI